MRDLISVEPDQAIKAIFETWPTALAASRAKALGLTTSQTLDDIVDDYMEDYGRAARPV